MSRYASTRPEIGWGGNLGKVERIRFGGRLSTNPHSWQWARHSMANHIKKIYDDLWVHPITVPEKRDTWYAKYFVWRLGHWTLAALSIMFPAVAAASGGTVATVFAVAAAVTAGIIAFLGAQDQRDKFNVAWMLLDVAMKTHDDEKIKEAEARGESIINGEALQKYAPDKFTKPQT